MLQVSTARPVRKIGTENKTLSTDLNGSNTIFFDDPPKMARGHTD
jgi:hypothetical protein